MDKPGEDWNGLNLGKFEKRRPIFFQIYISLYQNVIYKAGKSFSGVMWPWFCKWKTLALPIWRLELIINKIKQNYLKSRDLAPLAQARGSISFPFPCACAYACVRLRRVKTKESINTRKFVASGQLKHSSQFQCASEHLNKMAVAVVDFDAYVDFRFH